jgi:hypothetical protein
MTFTLLSALLVFGAAQPPAASTLTLVAASADVDDGDAEEARDDTSAIDEDEGEPFPWDTVSGVAIGIGGFLVGLGGTAAGAGALLLTAPGTLAAYNVAAFALVGVGAVVGLVGTGAAGGGGALYWFTLPDDEEEEAEED